MNTVPVYQLDFQGIFLRVVDLDPFGPMPPRSTTVAPPATSGTEVAQCIDDVWTVLAERPSVERPDIVAAKAAKNDEINSSRAAANLSTFPHAGKLIACDALSRSDIDGVANNIALFGQFPAGFPGGWKAVDNTVIPLPTVDAFRAMYASMTAQGTANFNRAQALKVQLAAASTPEEVAEIAW